jgi:predicted HicB family RNase H-like nuclease
MSHQQDHYLYRVMWSEDDQEYVGLCAEFPSLSWLADTQDDAWQGIRRLVADCLDDMKAHGETLPVPLTEKRYSGHFQVRIPPEAHRNLVIQATEAGISLNRLVSFKLTQ